MPKEITENWSQGSAKAGKQVQVSKGSLILEIAERILPWVKECLKDIRDNNGMLLQPSAMRAIALNTAQLYIETEGQ